MTFTDVEIAVAAKERDTDLVAPCFLERHAGPILAASRTLCGGESDLGYEVLHDALSEWRKMTRKGEVIHPPLAESWLCSKGASTLQGYLQRSLRTRHADRCRWAERHPTVSIDGPHAGINDPSTIVEPPPSPPERLDAACRCWVEAARATAARYPRETLCAWLTVLCKRQDTPLRKMLYPVRVRAAEKGAAWLENPGAIPRLLKQYHAYFDTALEQQRTSMELTKDDLEEAQQRFEGCLRWAEMPWRAPVPSLTVSERQILHAFATGVPTAVRRQTVAWLMTRPDAVRELARDLPKEHSRGQPMPGRPVKIPVVDGLTGQHGVLYGAARNKSNTMTPGQLAARLGAVVREVFGCLIAATGAESGTLWLRDGRELMAMMNPLEKNVLGLRVPAHKGFVHQVLTSEKPLAVCPQELIAAARHCRKIDALVGRSVHAMVVVPFFLFGSIAGVITLVRFSPKALPFGDVHLGQAISFAQFAAGALESRLQREAARRVPGFENRLQAAVETVLAETAPADLCTLLAPDPQKPDEAPQALSPRVLKHLIAWVLAAAGSDAGTLWLQRDEFLEAALNPHEPLLIGQRQLASEGIMGAVFQSGRAEAVPHVPGDRRYQPRIDREVARRTTCSMVVAPFGLFGRRRGVVTMVRHQPELGPFEAGAIGRARLLAALLTRQLEDALRCRLMDPSEEITLAAEALVPPSSRRSGRPPKTNDPNGPSNTDFT